MLEDTKQEEIKEELIDRVESLCPTCLSKIDALILKENLNYYMDKTCPSHGTIRTILWRGGVPMTEWINPKLPAKIEHPFTSVNKGCPFDCGLCSEHRQHTCTALIEVTQACNLRCTYCFADAGKNKEQDPSLMELERQYKTILQSAGACNIQLSGGEPTLRDDLPSIIALGKKLGFPFIQVNTNGIRLAREEAYLKALKEAGLNSIYLQFDGTDDSIYQALRGQSLFAAKAAAIENCKKYGIGVVLVPTLVPGINLHQVGDIISFGMRYSPTVRGIHFQPVSYFGRIQSTPSDPLRITLPEIMQAIEEQTNGMVTAESLKPPGCENALCSFHGSYLLQDKQLVAMTKQASCSCSTQKNPIQAEEGAKKTKEYVARKWNTPSIGSEPDSDAAWDRILQTIERNSFSLSAMAFQDVWNVNLERIKDCCIHVATIDNKLIPFCMYNITDKNGRSLYRQSITTKEEEA